MQRDFVVAMLILTAAATGARASDDAPFVEPIATLPTAQQAFRVGAVKGEYQAMRNLAFSYATSPNAAAGSRAHRVAGCAWYLLIPAVHKAKFHVGDAGNIRVYCGRLTPEEFNASYSYAFKQLATP